MQKHEAPQVRLPNKLPSKPGVEEKKVAPELRDTLDWNRANRPENEGEEEEEDDAENMEKTWDRSYIKSSSDRYVRNKLKKAANDKKEATAATTGNH